MANPKKPERKGELAHRVLDADEMLAVLQGFRDYLAQNDKAVAASGLDLTVLLPKLTGAEQVLAHLLRERNDAMEALLHCLADRADADREFFLKLKRIAHHLDEAYPYDSSVQELQETVSRAGRHFPPE